MKFRVMFLLLTALAFGQEKSKPPADVKGDVKAPSVAELVANLQRAASQLVAADSAMKEAALDTQQKTIKFYQAATAQESAFRAAKEACKGELVQEDMVWRCKPIEAKK